MGLRRLVWVWAGLMVVACTPPSVKPIPESAAVPEAREAKEPAVAQPAAEPLPEEQQPHQPAELTSSLLYDVLLGEIAGQRGRLDVSGQSYLAASRESTDPQIAERALKIAVYGKQPELALQAARRWVELAPDNLEARQALAALALRTGQDQEALEQFTYLLGRTDAAGTPPYQGMLVLLAREPDQQRAMQVMEQLVESRPDDAELHFTFARLAVHAEDWTIAGQEVNESLQLHPDWTPALILRAQISMKQGQSDVARQQLEAALQRKPDDSELRLAYARLLVDLDEFDLAREQYRQILKQHPDNGQVVYSLALLALEAGQLDEAGKLFERLLELGVQPQQAYYYLGAIAEEQGKYKRAIHWYEKVEKGDHWLEVQIRIARLEARQGDVKPARDRLRTLRLSNPAQAQRLFLVEGDILSEIGRDDEAYQLYTDYLDTQPDDMDILYARSLIAERLDRLDDAERDLRKVLAQDPDNARALNALGYTLADRTDRYQEALGYIEKALQQTPDDPSVIDSMGWVLYRLGRLEESREHLQRAYDLTEDSEIAAHLGEVMWVMGERDAARALWKKARESTPGDSVLEDTIRRFSP